MLKIICVLLFLIFLILCTDIPFMTLRHIIMNRAYYCLSGCCYGGGVLNNVAGLSIAARLYKAYANQFERLAAYYYLLDNTVLTDQHWPDILDYNKIWEEQPARDLLPALCGKRKKNDSLIFIRRKKMASSRNRIFVYVHGGAMISGSAHSGNTRIFVKTIATFALADKYNIVVSLDYSLAPENKSPTALVDIITQLVCLQRLYKCESLMIYGFSAGAFLVAQFYTLLTVIRTATLPMTDHRVDPRLFDLTRKNHGHLLEALAGPNFSNCPIKFVFTAGFYDLSKLYYNDVNISRSFKLFTRLYFLDDDASATGNHNVGNVIAEKNKTTIITEQHDSLNFYKHHCPYTILKAHGKLSANMHHFITDTSSGSLGYQASKFSAMLHKLNIAHCTKNNDLSRIYEPMDLRRIEPLTFVGEADYALGYRSTYCADKLLLDKQTVNDTITSTTTSNHFFIYNCYIYASRNHLMRLLNFSLED